MAELALWQHVEALNMEAPLNRTLPIDIVAARCSPRYGSIVEANTLW